MLGKKKKKKEEESDAMPPLPSGSIKPPFQSYTYSPCVYNLAICEPNHACMTRVENFFNLIISSSDTYFIKNIASCYVSRKCNPWDENLLQNNIQEQFGRSA